MKRDTHLFQFLGETIAAAARIEAEFHRGRAAFWNGQYEMALEEAKRATIDVTEYDVTGGKRASVSINTKAAQRLDECTSKRHHHQKIADEFAIEAAAYGTQPSRMYELDSEDVIHFRLAGGEREE